jgi:DNA-binding CsgD family transcriptional regulator
VTDLPELPDLWAPVGTRDLPPAIVSAFMSRDWVSLRRELSTVMDGSATDGPLGRELLQVILALPAGFDAVFDRYRVQVMLDHGDWDGVREALPGQSIEPTEVRGKRDILTAPVDRNSLPPSEATHERLIFELWEHIARNSAGLFRHWIQRESGHYPAPLWDRQDIPLARHLRFRLLLDATLLAAAESVAGRVSVAHAAASEATRLGEEREPIRAVAQDLSGLTRLALGDRFDFELQVPLRICEPTGPSPLGTGECLLYISPLLPLRNDDALGWCAELLARIASRLAFPRWQLQADAWRIASDLRAGAPSGKTDLAGLVARARRAPPGLRALPTFLQGFADRRYEPFEEAEHFARLSGNVWLQISAMAWMTALDPRAKVAKRLRQLIEATGWRRLVLVPSEIAADAALGMTTLGERSEAILELALIADRPTVTTDLIARYIDDPKTPQATRVSAVNALGRVGTTHAREILARLAQRRDDIGKAAAKTAEGPTYGLSEREIEVLSLAADGLTNKQIGEKLFLSPHTIARHLANARGKLGASNRAEAAVRMHRAGVE